MAKPYTITISNGSGQENVLNGEYSVTSNTTGYVNTTIDPSSINVVEGTNEYAFKISADGNLIIHVTETGQSDGTPVVGAKFIRCDSLGNTYGNEITTDSSGNATLSNVPYDSTTAPTIYYKQTTSDGEHEFDNTLKNIQLNQKEQTIEVANTLGVIRTFKLTDANYEGLNIESGSITLS